MPYTLWFWTDADESLNRLEHDQSLRLELRAVQRILGRLELAPFEATLKTRQFVTDELGHIRATPTGQGDWYVFWQLGEEAEAIEIVQIAELPL